MKLLVTGGCGFIGANFIRMIMRRHSDAAIINLDKLTYAGNRLNLLDLEQDESVDIPNAASRYTFVQGDIGDAGLVERLLEEHRPQAVVNFAAETHVDRSIHDAAPFLTTNVLATHTLFETARKAGTERFVHVSTDEVYGSLGPEGRFTEQTPLAPNSPYSASKASSDLLARALHETHGFPVIITRCSNNYGPYQFPEKLFPLMFQKATSGEPLPVYGDGLNVRDWIYVTDHCRGVELALLRGEPGAVYNFGGDAEKTNLEVVRALLKTLGKPEDLIRFVKDRPGHDRRYAMDFSLARRDLGFEPEYDFQRGLDETVAWYRENEDWLASVQDGSYRDFMSEWYRERA